MELNDSDDKSKGEVGWVHLDPTIVVVNEPV